MTKSYTFNAKVWLYPGESGSWHFVTLPVEIAKDINDFFALAKRGWGSLPVVVTVGKAVWKTSIFPDKKTNSYLLPLKAEVRKKEAIRSGDSIDLMIKVSD
jgi:hypothetical protein